MTIDSGFCYRKTTQAGGQVAFRQVWHHDGSVEAETETGDRQRYYTKDFQRQRCYSLEHLIERAHADRYDTPVDLVDAQGICNAVTDAYGIKPISQVTLKKGNARFSTYHPHTAEIRLNTWGLKVGIVLHEVAHHVARELSKDLPYRIVGHGPEFMSFLFEIYEIYLGIDLSAFRTVKPRGGKKGLQFADGWASRPVHPEAYRPDNTKQGLMARVEAARVALADAEAALTAYETGR